MNTAEKIYQEIQTLSESDAREILDFVEFLKSKRRQDIASRRANALATLEKFKGRYDGSKFNRDELYDRPCLR